MSEYPEHEKLHAVAEQSQAMGEFLDLGPYTLCEFVKAGSNKEPLYVWTPKWADPAYRRKRGKRYKHPRFIDFLNGHAETNPDHESWGDHYRPVMKPLTQVLADWFDIDLDKIEQEKREMLDKIREANARAA